jgi:hypothetical protein
MPAETEVQPDAETPAASDQERAEETGGYRPGEVLTFLGFLALMCVSFVFRLRSVIISDMDEGTYVYAGQLIERGLVPYRDFMLAHPPLIAVLVAGWCHAFGCELMSVRLAYIALILLSTIPLYALVRRVSSSRSAALLTIVSYTSGMLLVANMGRTVRLEPLMNAFVIGAFACRFLRPRSPAWMSVMGALFACGLLVKVIAIVPAGLLLLTDLLWVRPWRDTLRRWLAAAAGAVPVLLPALLWCLKQPRFVEDVFLGQVNRPRIDVLLRCHYLAQNIARYPPILVGLVAALIYAATARDARVRSLAWVAVGSTLILVFGFRTFFNYYIVQALPWIACCLAIALNTFAERALGKRWFSISTALAAVWGVLLPLGYAEAYHRTGSFHVAGPLRILPFLRGGEGYMYSMYAGFGVWTGRSQYPWYYQADSLVPRINGWIGDRDFVKVFSGSTALVLFPGELDDFPLASEYVQANFTRAYRDADWSLWLRPTPRSP